MATTDAPPDRPPFWSPWGDRLIATLAAGVAACIAWWWIGTSYLMLPLSTYVSWKPDDGPVPVPPNVPEPILGGHFFGDFQESRWWGLDILHGSSPYDFANIYPPFAPWVMVPFAALPLAVALAAYLVLSSAMIVLPAWLLLRQLPPATRIVVVALVAAATAPLLTTLDRGNLQGVTIGLVGFGLVALQRRRTRWAVVLFALGICLKPFIVIVIVIALVRRQRRFATNTLALALAVTVVSWLLLPGDRSANLQTIIVSQGSATGGPDFQYDERIWANLSLHGLIANVQRLFVDAAGAVTSNPPGGSVLLAVGWITVVGVIAWRHRVPQWVWAVVALSAIQLAQPYSSVYTLSWATLAAVWFGAGRLLPPELVGADNESDDRWTGALRVLTLAALAVTLLPLALRPTISDVTIPVQQILSPILWLCIGLLALVASFARPAPGPPTVVPTVI